MDTLMEFSIQGDIFFFYDTLSEEEKETVRKCMRARYKGHIVGDPTTHPFIMENDTLMDGYRPNPLEETNP